jgi:acyl-CoA thioester hydrolase
MENAKEYVVNETHIGAQGIMDGQYHPFYMEYCRHDFIREAPLSI